MQERNFGKTQQVKAAATLWHDTDGTSLHVLAHTAGVWSTARAAGCWTMCGVCQVVSLHVTAAAPGHLQTQHSEHSGKGSLETTHMHALLQKTWPA
jgi:hypothetical protein